MDDIKLFRACKKMLQTLVRGSPRSEFDHLHSLGLSIDEYTKVLAELTKRIPKPYISILTPEGKIPAGKACPFIDDCPFYEWDVCPSEPSEGYDGLHGFDYACRAARGEDLNRKEAER